MDVPAPTMDRNIECGGHPAPVFWDNGATSSCSKPVTATTNALEAVVRWYAACPYSLLAQRAFCSHARPNWQLALLCMEQDSVADLAPPAPLACNADQSYLPGHMGSRLYPVNGWRRCGAALCSDGWPSLTATHTSPPMRRQYEVRRCGSSRTGLRGCGCR